MWNRVVLLSLGLGFLCSSMRAEEAASPPPDYWNEPQEMRDARMAWFNEARFGMFIHWGLYSIPGGKWKGKEIPHGGEWIMDRARIPEAEYRELLEQFNPVKYDPREWVRIAKDAGMKYIVITSKHHDGFCLWDSPATDFDVMATRYGKDLLKPLAEACEEAGIAFCTYHSIMDWTHPNYAGTSYGTRRDPDMKRYTAYLKEQLAELVTGYGPLGIMWFDGEWEGCWTHEAGKDLYEYVRSLQPSIIVNNRVDKGRRGMQGMTSAREFRGDYGTPEQQIPAGGLPGVAWESCMTMNGTWGFKAADKNWKSSTTLIRNLVDSASKGGNYLLNVGPTAEGEIPVESIERLNDMGEWLRVNGEAIYGSSANPLGRLSFGRATMKGGRIFLHIFDWPEDGQLTIPAEGLQMGSVYALADATRAQLPVRMEGGGAKIDVSKVARDPHVTVITVEYAGELPKDLEVSRVRPNAKGEYLLTPADVHFSGEGPIKADAAKGAITTWVTAKNQVGWKLTPPPKGEYELAVEYACKPGSQGTPIVLSLGEARIELRVEATKGWDDYTTLWAGRIHGDGKADSLTIIAQEKPPEGVMNIQSLLLIPAGTHP